VGKRKKKIKGGSHKYDDSAASGVKKCGWSSARGSASERKEPDPAVEGKKPQTLGGGQGLGGLPPREDERKGANRQGKGARYKSWGSVSSQGS